jgi:putative component of membrane protein insertase Oxa1/YidC/SpoIIIJ protein YidD
MKSLGVGLICLYRLLKPTYHLLMVSLFGFTFTCRYRESCSHYTLRQVKKHGTITGFKKGLRRVLSCNGYAIS